MLDSLRKRGVDVSGDRRSGDQDWADCDPLRVALTGRSLPISAARLARCGAATSMIACCNVPAICIWDPYFLQGELCAETPALFARARQLGLTTSLDTNYDPSPSSGRVAWQRCCSRPISFCPTKPNQAWQERYFDTALQNLSASGALVVASLARRAQWRVQGKLATAHALKVDVVDTTGGRYL